MTVWKHVVENLIALTSLLLVPYVFIAAGLALAFAWTGLRLIRWGELSSKRRLL